MKLLKLQILVALLLGASALTARESTKIPSRVTMSREVLLDKIKGGWAGQVLGCTYGGPTEFKWRSEMIPADHEIPWGRLDQVSGMMKSWPTLYDDIYMDLTFVGVFDRLGLDAPQDSLAMAFANEGYHLWHANQAARYNLLNGIPAPESGHWRNNPHADDIDYQIEADFAGIMSPGMPNAASEISDRAGHIMNYGNGWYGGVYMGAMYALAFVTDDVEVIVTEALRTIPRRSSFYRCMADVIDIYHTYPDDWRKGWQVCQDKWGHSDVGCSEGALAPLNIDALINSAYVIFGLLYGEGDWMKTIDISTRCGQDSDCNPASAAGILATAIGYNRIPADWLEPLKQAEDMDFAYLPYSLNDTYDMSFRHALAMIERYGGEVTDNDVTIKCQRPKPVAFEQSFPNLTPTERKPIGIKLDGQEWSYTADCAGIIFNGWVRGPKEYVAELEVSVDGGEVERFTMPALYRLRRLDVYWNFLLKPGSHTVTLRWLNPTEGTSINVADAVLFQKSR
ncbi:MAG: ADP-ribosylglycohydrolase family protein [Rikenellaceae bacterium]|nr:ADP-ribosylglycohydrolase family protein [Rikenellaceae bacterium]